MNKETEEVIYEYIERYCRKHHVTAEEALEHKIVQEVIKSYLDREEE